MITLPNSRVCIPLEACVFVPLDAHAGVCWQGMCDHLCDDPGARSVAPAASPSPVGLLPRLFRRADLPAAVLERHMDEIWPMLCGETLQMLFRGGSCGNLPTATAAEGSAKVPLSTLESADHKCDQCSGTCCRGPGHCSSRVSAVSLARRSSSASW